jgi:hypothetical protein
MPKAQRKKLSKKKRRWGCFALCGARGGLRALHLRKLLKKFDQNLHMTFAKRFSRATRHLLKKLDQNFLI